jgi:hypothetical protein
MIFREFLRSCLHGVYGVEVEWSVSMVCESAANEDRDADADSEVMNAGVGLLFLKIRRSLLDCLHPYLLASFESKSSVFWRITMRRLQLFSFTVAWTTGRCCCLQ